MDQASLAFVLLGLFGSTPEDTAHLASLEERHRQSVASPAGRKYEPKALRAFFGDSAFLSECAASESPDPITIWFAVAEDGRMGELAIDPASHAARCIAIAVRGRTFPAPPGPFVGRVDLPPAD